MVYLQWGRSKAGCHEWSCETRSQDSTGSGIGRLEVHCPRCMRRDSSHQQKCSRLVIYILVYVMVTRFARLPSAGDRTYCLLSVTSENDNTLSCWQCLTCLAIHTMYYQAHQYIQCLAPDFQIHSANSILIAFYSWGPRGLTQDMKLSNTNIYNVICNPTDSYST